VREFHAVPDDDLIALHDAIDRALADITLRVEDDTKRERLEKVARGTDGDARDKTEAEVATSRGRIEAVEARRVLRNGASIARLRPVTPDEDDDDFDPHGASMIALDALTDDHDTTTTPPEQGAP
jgi:hypothetical protein